MTTFLNAAVVDKKTDHVTSSPAGRLVEVETAWDFAGAGTEEDSSAGGVDDSAEAGDPVEMTICRRIQTSGMWIA